MIRSLALACLLASPACADGAQDFVTANIISTLYHEFGHALIDQTKTPVSGSAENAADSLSVILLDAFWDEDAAESIIALTALSFELAAQEAENPTYWQMHSLDLQRYYHQVCLFYGADPGSRTALAQDFEISEGSATACIAEFATAAATWAQVMDPLKSEKPEKYNQFNGDTSSDVATLLAGEIRDLNASFFLPKPIVARLADCGEENAVYDPESATITICTEYVAFLERQTIANDL